VNDYPLHINGWTPPGRGIQKAIQTLDGAAADHLKFVVLLSDGEVNHALDGIDCEQKNNLQVTTEAGNKIFSKGE
jgi:hypothetical protein